MLNIVAALSCEAKPIRCFYNLSSSPVKHSFPIYQNENICLIVSGIGKVNSAAAVAYLHALCKEESSIWLNIGIAGHGKLDIGEMMLVDRITDKATNQSWYPPIVYKNTCHTCTLQTVDVPQINYQGEAAFDMEASGYYPTATRFATGELVQCVKIISDNSKQTTESINASKVEMMIADNMEGISNIASALIALQNTLPKQENIAFKELTSAWHFTMTQRHQLGGLLQSCLARRIDVSLGKVKYADCASANDVLNCIINKLEETPVVLTY